MRFPPGQPGGSAGAAQRAPAVAPPSGGAGIVVCLALLSQPTDGGRVGPSDGGFPLGPGEGLDEGPGFVFELEEVDDFDGSAFLWSVR